MNAAPISAAALPTGFRRTAITVCAMAATIMQALDTTIANIALPYMQGSLSASLDQVNWVLTSYIVAAAIMTAPVGWLADRFGRKRLFIFCVALFTATSLLCAIAQSIDQIVLFRLLQGAGGAALVPLSQTVIMDSYPPDQRTRAMAVWGIGIMLGPIMGPMLGGWLTDHYSWNWVFLINVPIGIMALIGIIFFLDETKLQKNMRFDWAGFIALAIGIGSLQLMLDRGEQRGWFESKEIIVELIVSIVGFYYFFAHSLTTREPFIRFELFKDRFFVGGCLFMAVMGVVLFGTTALITPFLQNELGYPILTAGYLIGARGCGTLLAMIAFNQLLKWTQERNLIGAGLLLTSFTLWQMTEFTENTTSHMIVTTGVVQGAGFGLVFVSLSNISFRTLPAHLRTAGSSILTLARNIGSSIGISVVIANLTNKTTYMHARIVESVTPFNNALQWPGVAATLDPNTDAGRAMLDGMVTRQASIIAYQNDYKLLMYMTLATLPLLVVLGVGIRKAPARQAGQIHVLE